MFIDPGRQLAPDPPDLADLEKHCATISINIPRLRRYGIREVANSIPNARAPKAAVSSSCETHDWAPFCMRALDSRIRGVVSNNRIL
jgi:hypothetical protein